MRRCACPCTLVFALAYIQKYTMRHVILVLMLLPTAIFGFFISMVSGFVLAPIILKILRKGEDLEKKMWKDTMYGKEASVFNEVTKKLKGEQKVPRMGGFLIFFPILISLSAISFFFASELFFWFAVFLWNIFLHSSIF